VTYEVIGWHTTVNHMGYLAPMMLINLASLIIIVVARRKASGHASADDPTHPMHLLAATRSTPEGNEGSNGFTDNVVYRRGDVRAWTVQMIPALTTDLDSGAKPNY
jgi:hypothetical protein